MRISHVYIFNLPNFPKPTIPTLLHFFCRLQSMLHVVSRARPSMRDCMCTPCPATYLGTGGKSRILQPAPSLATPQGHVICNHSNKYLNPSFVRGLECAAKMDKKLAKKLAKMSEEERAQFLEQQRLQEEEMKKKKEEMLSRFLKVNFYKSSSYPIMD